MRNTYLQAAAGLLALFVAAAAQAATPSLYPVPVLDANKLPVAVVVDLHMAVADFNGDGIEDIAVSDGLAASSAPPAGGVWIFMGRQQGGFTAPAFHATASRPASLAAGDLNGDGWPDIVTANSDSSAADQVSVLINKGDGGFKDHVDYSPDAGATFSGREVSVADATGDGHLDVVLGTSTNTVYAIPGAGDGTLDVSATQALMTTYANTGALVTDINSDGDPDVVAASCRGNDPDRVEVFSGAPGGVFAATPDQSVAVGECASIAAVDANEDGRPDIAVNNFKDNTLQVLPNVGGALGPSGIFYQLPPLPHVGVPLQRLYTADLDGDGHADVLVPAGQFGDVVTVLYGHGDGGFRAPLEVSTGFTASAAVAVDANDDGQLDIVAANNLIQGLVVAHNLGGRRFLAYRGYAYQDGLGNGKTAADLAAADFNGDGYPDVVTANLGDDTLSVLANDRAGGFGSPTVLAAAGASGLGAVTTGDVNGDGDADIVTADTTTIYTWPGNGDSTFGAVVASPAAGSTAMMSLALADVDADGSPELVLIYSLGSTNLCHSDGAGGWTCVASVTVPKPQNVALTDLNGDGAPDMVVTTGNDSISVPGATDAYVYFNDNHGGFVPVPTKLPVAGGARGIAAADVSGDGATDLVFGSRGDSVSVFVGNGDGTFGSGAVFTSSINPTSHAQLVSLADVNGDAAPDIVVTNRADPSVGVLINNGDGTFAPSVNFAADHLNTPAFALNMDGDGLADIVTIMSSFGPANTVAVYLHNHAPIVARAAALTLDENTTGAGTLTASDRELDPLSFAIATPAAHGTVNLDAATGHYTYTPRADYSGGDSFSATAGDGLNTSAPVTVSIMVQAVTPPGDDSGDTVAPPSNGGDAPPLASPNGSSGGGGGWGLLGAWLLLGALWLRRKRGQMMCGFDGASGAL